MNFALVLLGLGIALGIYFWWSKMRDSALVRTVCEFWVYLGQDGIPTQDDAMKMVLSRPGITKTEGMLMSDIRLHIGLVKKDKNPHAFRPDVLADDLEITPERLSALAQAKSFVRVRFLSDTPLFDSPHIALTLQLAACYSALGGGTAVFDQVAQKLYTAEEFEEFALHHAKEATAHTKVTWTAETEVGFGKTRGLNKIGLPDLITAPTPLDMRNLVEQVLQEAIAAYWKSASLESPLEIEFYGDTISVEVNPSGGSPREVRIFRSRKA